MLKKEHLTDENCKTTFSKKKTPVKILINEALTIINSFGVPLKDLTPRRMERMAICFLALADVKSNSEWKNTRDLSQGASLKTREIIQYVNENFNENISPGSYDDIRRKDLKLLVLSEVIVHSKPGTATNDATRGYALSEKYAKIIRKFGEKSWYSKVNKFMCKIIPLSKKLSQKRDQKLIPIKIGKGGIINFSLGEHNVLQKSVVEEFLPRYGYGAEVLYVGDTTKKFLHIDKNKLNDLKFFKIAHEELPDIIAYSKKKKWLYLIEAVHSSGPISPVRLHELKRLTKKCKADIVYVTAFLDKITFKKFINQIAWETEVWVAENPSHLIHFDGEKFLGPFKN
ncbi:BsuBI/PstI family type II restriction endonuclease [Nanoarchaeota archaeon]